MTSLLAIPALLLASLAYAQSAPRLRTLTVRPADTPEVQLSAAAPTVLIFEDQVVKADPADPKGRIVASPAETVVTVIARRELGADRVPLTVTLKDGTKFRFTVASGDQLDAQVRVLRAGPEPAGPTVEGLLLEGGGVGYSAIPRGGAKANATGVLRIGRRGFLVVTTDGWVIARAQLRGRESSVEIKPGPPAARPSFALTLRRPEQASGEFALELYAADGRVTVLEGLPWP